MIVLARPSIRALACCRALHLVLAAVVLFAPRPLEAQEHASVTGKDLSPEMLSAAEPADVTVWNRFIVQFRTQIGEVTPQMRADGATRRIAQLPFANWSDPVSVLPAKVGELEGYLVMVGTTLVFSLVSEDVPPENHVTLESYARGAAARLEELLNAKRAQAEPRLIAKAVAVTAIATVVLALLLIGLLRARTSTERWLARRWASRRLKLIGLNMEPLMQALESGLVNIGALTVAIVLLSLWLGNVLPQFPFTQPLAGRLGRWVIELLLDLGLSAISAIPGLFTVAVIFFLTRIATGAVSSIFRAIESGVLSFGWVTQETAPTTRNLIKFGIWIFAVTIAYPYIPGSNTDAFKGVTVLLGVMISLGSAGLINQLMSGLVIVYSRALRNGDFARVGDREGFVKHIGLLSMKLTTLEREEVTVPNAVVVGNTIVNYARETEPDGLLVIARVTIGYDTPWRQVHALLELAAARTAGLRAQPKPFVVQRALSDFYVEYELRAHLAPGHELLATRTALNSRILDAFNEFDVQIMSPHFVLNPGERVVVPHANWSPPPAPPRAAEDPGKA